ncbi:S41 family peptidase [Aquimarina muelleri]|uniref:Peptidase S41 n=1 Tax=Aquimarina muelleri TaxID=279356 RepID=A0A918JY55_9FLAO|nr:S41 family peptidase [Aquimarina muelleri]MCX2763274.1 S41 family peptidase [Aquimarina muelleri]GGX27496.1 peptidase S41 [Aquimarina muelleri]
MRKIQFFMFFCIYTYVISAQKNIDSIAVKEDFKIFESILKKGHPSLYEYISNDSIENIFKTTKESLKRVTSDIELYKKMINVTDKIKDGHLLLLPPNTIKTDQHYFPLILKLINTEFYVDTDDFKIPIGSKINRINQVEASEILEKLKKHIPSDGYNLTRKYREIELKFGLYFAYEYGIQKEFNIDYTEPNGTEKNSILPSESFTKVRLRNTKRNSYFAKFHQKENGFDYFDAFINKKDPFVYYKNEINTAVLVVNSFGGDIRIFKSKLIKIFQEIHKKKINHLIIDVRRNEGGFRPNAIHLYSFITDSIFKQRTSEYIASLTVPEREYVTRTYFNEKEFLKDRFNNHPIYDGWKLKFDDLETIMVPNKNRFKGKVYVLTSGSTFSAGSTFVLNAKNNPNIMVIGEETGGGYYFHTGEYPVFYEFPNSKIIMTMYMEKINHYILDNTVPKGSGILPDKNILLSTEDLISGKDPELDYIFRWIKG